MAEEVWRARSRKGCVAQEGSQCDDADDDAQKEAVAKNLNEFYGDYNKRSVTLPQELAELRAKGFPQPRPDVKVE